MTMRLVLCLSLSVPFLMGCGFVMDSFRDVPGQPPVSLPTWEMVFGSNVRVSVRMFPGSFGPTCMLPDAANELACYFYYGWFEGGSLMSIDPGGYRRLTSAGAREACAQAMWSAQGNVEEIAACSRALMIHRWMVEPDVFEEVE